MKHSWFYHFNCTAQQADELVSRYQSRGIKTERSLSLDYLSWTVAAWLPEQRHHPRSLPTHARGGNYARL